MQPVQLEAKDLLVLLGRMARGEPRDHTEEKENEDLKDIVEIMYVIQCTYSYGKIYTCRII